MVSQNLNPVIPADEHVFQAAANMAGKEEFGTLILDSVGRIRNSSGAGARLFGAGPHQMEGRPISVFMAEMFFSHSSPGFGVRYLAYLCSGAGWRDIEAVDVNGNAFALEFNLSRVTSDGQDLFLLNLRRSTTPLRH